MISDEATARPLNADVEANAISVSHAVETRRSIKVFDPMHRMSEQEMKWLFERAILSPTAFNIQHWRFVRVKEPALRKRIRALAWDQAQVTDASILLVLCADLKAWNKSPHRYWENTPKEIQESMVESMRQFYGNDVQLERDEAIRSCSFAACSLMLLAKELGYDSCPMDGFDFAEVAQLINLPKDCEICMMLPIGKALEPPYPRSGQLLTSDVVFTDRFPDE